VANETVSPDKEGDVSVSTDSVVIGMIVGFHKGTVPKVSFQDCPLEQGLEARTTVSFTSSDIGKQVALLFESGNPKKPVIIGKIQVPVRVAPEQMNALQKIDATLDGERLTFTAGSEIVLRCGKASITLTRAGKIIIRGAYLLNRSSGVNKIKGASVQIN
jgi:hypothetical protein